MLCDDDYVQPEEVWACCDRCGKWRKLPPGIREDDLPSVWYCYMNPDPTHNLCKHAEEQESQDSYQMVPPHNSGGGGGAPSNPSLEKSHSRTKATASAGGASSSTAPAEKERDKDKASNTPAAQAAQQAHLAALFPQPRLPTAEDVCTTCEGSLVPAGSESKPAEVARLLGDPAHILFCHGLCGRMWHRKCATVDAAHTADGSAAGASAAASASAAAASSSSAAAAQSQTHVYPFTPATVPYWYCNECLHLTGHCFSCFHAGTCDPLQARIPNPERPKRRMDNPDYLLQCPFQAGCGKLYHRKCLFELPRTMTHKPSRATAGSRDTNVQLTPNLVPRPRAGLICGLHACHTCGAGGTASTNMRDVGRTLIHCIRCPAAFHWSSKCRPNDEVIKPSTKRYGVCDSHEEEGEDAEDADVIQRRTDSIAQLTLAHGIAPMPLWGIDAAEQQPSDSDEDDEDEDDEDEDGEDDDNDSEDEQEDDAKAGEPKTKKQRT